MWMDRVHSEGSVIVGGSEEIRIAGAPRGLERPVVRGWKLPCSDRGGNKYRLAY